MLAGNFPIAQRRIDDKVLIMKVVKVEYQVKDEFIEQNKKNIEAIIEELKGRGDVGVKYFANIKEDGKTFVHINIMRDDVDPSVMSEMDSFKKFQKELGENVTVKPEVTPLKNIASSFDV